MGYSSEIFIAIAQEQQYISERNAELNKNDRLDEEKKISKSVTFSDSIRITSIN